MVRPVKPTTKDSRCQLKGQTGTLCPAMVHDPHLLMISQASQERKKEKRGGAQNSDFTRER